MYCDELILALANEAPKLTNAGLRLLIHLIALSIEQGTNELTITHRTLAEALNMSKEGVAMGIRHLAAFIRVTTQDRKSTTITIPAEWLSPQRQLFVNQGKAPHLFNRPGNQDRSALANRADLGQLPGQIWADNQDTNHATRTDLGQLPGQLCPGNPQNLSWKPENQDSDTYRNAPARVDRSIDIDSTHRSVVELIDRALRTVEILPHQEQDAAILSEVIRDYRTTLKVASLYPGSPDRIIQARLLAIAPIEDLCGTLRKLIDDKVRPGEQDMWFFTVLMQRLHGASPKTVANRHKALFRRKPPMNENSLDFSEDLLRRVRATIKPF